DRADAELEPDREEQQDHAEIGQRADEPRVADRTGEMWADHEPCEQVAEHDREPEPPEHDGHDRGRAEHDRELGQAPWKLGRHASSAPAARPCAFLQRDAAPLPVTIPRSGLTREGTRESSPRPYPDPPGEPVRHGERYAAALVSVSSAARARAQA